MSRSKVCHKDSVPKADLLPVVQDVIAPADGRVLVAGPAIAASAPPGSWQQVSIFLSPMDVHVNRVPVSGRVTQVTYRPGRFLPAYHTDAAATNGRSPNPLLTSAPALRCKTVGAAPSVSHGNGR